MKHLRIVACREQPKPMKVKTILIVIVNSPVPFMLPKLLLKIPKIVEKRGWKHKGHGSVQVIGTDRGVPYA